MPINNADFAQTINSAYDQLRQFSEEESGQIPMPGKWSKKQIIGHLIDSASNNHQRFVRAQQTPDLHLPGYAQMDWVKLQNYHTESWEPLLMLWKCYNQHLAHVIANISEEKSPLPL